MSQLNVFVSPALGKKSRTKRYANKTFKKIEKEGNPPQHRVQVLFGLIRNETRKKIVADVRRSTRAMKLSRKVGCRCLNSNFVYNFA